MKTLLIGIVAVVIVAVIAVIFISTNNQPMDIASSFDSNGEETATSNQTPNAVLGSKYVDYTKEDFDSASGKKRIFFFHAAWCPTCKVANENLTINAQKIPDDVIVFKTDYDTETDLKNKYGITYQHTFVQVDADGNELSKWNGGDIEELIANVK